MAARWDVHDSSGREHPLRLERHRPAPITVAQYPGERATIDIKGAAQGFFFTNSPNPSGAAYVNFKDFEVTNSDTNRSTRFPVVAFYVRTSDHLKFINLIVHDVGIGFDLNTEATNTEVYGSLIYYGDANATSGLAHGIYIQNVSGYKTAMDNVVFSNSGYGVHAFPHAGDSSLLDVSVVGNILFNNGLLGGRPQQPDLLVGGDAVAISPVVDGNMTYKTVPGTLWNQQIGLNAGCKSPAVTNNYFSGATAFTGCTSGLGMTGNTFLGPLFTRPHYGGTVTSLDIAAFPANTYATTHPTGIKVFVRPNQYEAGRANIAVYNWVGNDTVDVPVTTVLNPGDVYEVRDVQDYFGAPVATGVYDGGPVILPMGRSASSQPVGLAAPPDSGPVFKAFVLSTTRYGRQGPSSPGQVRPPLRDLTPRPASQMSSPGLALD